jgi:2,4-dienoyl-CoA reductase-like NADH-dependent reductase (Old Yellow Enzyme family)
MPSELAKSLRLPCGATLPNRLAKSAMSEQLSDRTNAPTEDLARLYERWAKGGAGLIITGNVMIDRRALGEPRNVVVEDERDLPMLKRWAAAGSANGAAIWMQINHPGRQSPRFLSNESVAPSAVPVSIKGVFAPPRALTESEIEDIIARFARAAAIAKEAGFAGAQIHGAHGYLVNQFLSPRTNLRQDDWGGTLEKRMRFALEVMRAMRKSVGKQFPIGIKLNSADFQRGGFSEEESMAVVRALADEGIDLLEVSGGTYESAAMIGDAKELRESSRQREAYFLEYAQKARKLVKTPLMLTGGLRTVKTMESIIAAGDVDIIGMARPFAIEPDLPARILAGAATASATRSHRVGIQAVDGFVELMWHTQQLHRMGAGHDPDLNRSAWRTLAIALFENGWDSFRRKRG